MHSTHPTPTCCLLSCLRAVPCRAVPCYAGANLKTIAAALEPAKELKWLVLRTAGVVGELSCDILLPHLSLLSLTRNGISVSITQIQPYVHRSRVCSQS
jgi:hypothetical protein